MPILPAFLICPKEGAIIGRILAGYGDLEYQFSHCLSAALNDRGAAFRAFFRMRGEDQRIEVADALMRPHYEAAGFSSQYAEMIGALRWCRKIRNQYAHCHWSGFEKEGLYFTNMEVTAKRATGNISFKVYHVDEELVVLQEEYCSYTLDWLYHLSNMLKKIRNITPNHDVAAPKIIPQPSLYNPPEKHPYPRPKEVQQDPPK